MRLLIALAMAVGLVIAAGPAAAELPPQVYQQARESAGTVAVLRVQGVRRLPPGQTQGSCALTGVIVDVERGSAREGQTVVVAIPCISPAWEPRPGPFPGYRHDDLGRAERVRVFMSGGVLVRRGLDILD
jgi:hypothetical protein